MIYAKVRSRQRLHAFLGHLASVVEPSPGLECPALLVVDRDGTVHVFHWFFSIPFGPYSMTIWCLPFSGDLPTEGLPPMTYLPVDSFSVWRSIGAVPREDHIVRIKETPPLSWKTMPC